MVFWKEDKMSPSNYAREIEFHLYFHKISITRDLFKYFTGISTMLLSLSLIKYQELWTLVV